MAKKKLNFYSTDPNWKMKEDSSTNSETKEKSHQVLRVHLDRKSRRGKEVTLIKGFIGSEFELKLLGKTLQKLCGTGGSVKNNEIILQGNHCQKILEHLLKEGYEKTKISGGF